VHNEEQVQSSLKTCEWVYSRLTADRSSAMKQRISSLTNQLVVVPSVYSDKEQVAKQKSSHMKVEYRIQMTICILQQF